MRRNCPDRLANVSCVLFPLRRAVLPKGVGSQAYRIVESKLESVNAARRLIYIRHTENLLFNEVRSSSVICSTAQNTVPIAGTLDFER